jgi:uncharacterized membrane protein
MPLHPAIVHFPIVLSLVLVIFELRKDITSSLKTFILIIFCVSLSVSFFTGVSDSSLYVDVPENTQKLLSTHYNYSRAVFFLGLILLCMDFLKSKIVSHQNLVIKVYRILLAIVVGLIFTTGLLGGQLVYKQGLGVKIQENSSSE